MTGENCIQIRSSDTQLSLYVSEKKGSRLGRFDVRLRLRSIAPRVEELIAASVNKSTPYPRWGTPIVGEVVEAGSSISDLSVGDSVMGVSTQRDLPRVVPEYLVISREKIVQAVPEELVEFGYAALSDALMSFSSLRDAGQVKVGQRVLVLSPMSAPGFIGVQIAHSMGAQSIVTTHAEYVGLLRSVGAAEVWELGMGALVTRLSDIHVVYDPMGVSRLGHMEDCLGPSGRYISPVASLRRSIDQVWSQATARLINGIHISRLVERRVERRDLNVARRYLMEGQIRVDIADSIPLRGLLGKDISEWSQQTGRRVNILLA